MLSGVEFVGCDSVVDFSKTCTYLMHEMLRDSDAVVLNVKAHSIKSVRFFWTLSAKITNFC